MQRMRAGPTIAEELVLLPVPHDDKRTLAQAFVLLRLSGAPVFAPVLLDDVERGLECLQDEHVRQASIRAIVHLQHPECRRGCMTEMNERSRLSFGI